MAAVGPAPLRVLGSRPLAVLKQPKPKTDTSEANKAGYLGPEPWLFVNWRSTRPHPWLFLWKGKEGEGGTLHVSRGTHPSRGKHATRSTSCVGSCSKGLFLATLGTGPEPKARRSKEAQQADQPCTRARPRVRYKAGLRGETIVLQLLLLLLPILLFQLVGNATSIRHGVNYS